MYARVLTNEIQPGKAEEWKNIISDSLIPAFKKQKGFKGLILLVDKNSNKSIGCSMWETENDLNANDESPFVHEQLAKLKNLIAGQPVREKYELTILT